MHYQYHPLADLFPLLEGEDFDKLVADIKTHGQRDPILIHDNKILDGRNRYRACRAAGMEPIVEEFKGPGTPLAIIVSRNMHRRHLTTSQRAMIGGKIATMKVGYNKREKNGGAVTQREAAETLKVSKKSVEAAKTVLSKGTPEEIKAVETGKARVYPVANAIKKRQPPKPLTAAQQKLKEAARKKAEKAAKGAAGTAARLEKQAANAVLLAKLKQALTALTELPAPTDMAVLVRKQPTAVAVVKGKLDTAEKWLGGFANVWKG